MSKLIAISQAIFLSALLIGSSSHAKDSFFVTDIEGDHGIYISYDDYPSIHLVGHFSLPLAGMFANYQLGIEKVVVSEGTFDTPKNSMTFYQSSPKSYHFNHRDGHPRERLYEIILTDQKLISHVENLINKRKKFTFSIFQKRGYWSGIETDKVPTVIDIRNSYTTRTPLLIAAVTAQNLNVREISSNKVVTTLQKGKTVAVYDITNGWANIGYNRKVFADYLTKFPQSYSQNIENELRKNRDVFVPRPVPATNRTSGPKSSFNSGLEFLKFGGLSSIIAFLAMCFGLLAVQEMQKRKMPINNVKLVIGILLISSVYTLLTGIQYWQYAAEIPSEAGARASTKRGGGLIMIAIQYWPKICSILGFIYVVIYSFELKNFKVHDETQK
jgi:hypothetical protein